MPQDNSAREDTMFEALVNTLSKNVYSPSFAAEMHGIIAAISCAGNRLNGRTCLDEYLSYFARHYFGEVDKHLLIDIYAYTTSQLLRDEFYPLLPKEPIAPSLRAHALTQWCRGFLQGLTSADLLSEEMQQQYPDEILTALAQIKELSELDLFHLSTTEDDEPAIMEATYAIRERVQMIFDELNHDVLFTWDDNEKLETLH